MSDYAINYDDQKFKDVETDKKNAISELEKTYGGMINDSDAYYKAQVDATKEWEQKQTELQNQQTDFAIQEIEQNKADAKKDYTKEQSGAYVDYKKQSNEFGAEAEQRAAQGLENTGFSESSRVSMFNNYQNRVVAARETHLRIIQDFDNDITQARLQNNSALAEIAFNSLQKRLEINLQQLQNKNQLLFELSNKKMEADQMYHERWQDVLDQMNTENALAEEIRQYNESMAFEREQFEWQKAQAAARSSSSGGGRGGGGGGGSSSSSSNNKIKKLPQVDMNKSNTPASEVVSQNRVTSQNNLINGMIAAGASKDNVSNAISLGVANGTISKSEAAALRETYTPRGLQY